ncbi:MAG: hypothetical protein AAFV28_11345, partial [Cyanobacteria bacterium J06635_13]
NIFTGHKDGVNSVAIKDNLIVSGSFDGTVRVWNLETGELKHNFTDGVFTNGVAPVYGVDIDVRGNRIASGAYDGKVRVWNLETGELENTFTGHENWVMAVFIDGDRVFSGSMDGTIRIWDIE